MYLWHVKQLAKAFGEGRVTQRQQLWYLIGYLIGPLLLITPFVLDALEPGQPNLWDAAQHGVFVLGCVVGTLFCYRTSELKANSHEFLPRYISLGFVVGVRLLVGIAICAMVILPIIDLALSPAVLQDYFETEITTGIDVAMVGLFEFLYYMNLNAAIRESYA